MSRIDTVTRPLVAITISYIAGIVMGRAWLEEPFWAGWLAALLLLVAAGLVIRRLVTLFIAALLMVTAAIGVAAFIFASSPAPGGLLEYAGAPVYIEGTVVEEPLREEDCTTYQVRAEVVETKEGRRPVAGQLLVKVYGAEQESYWFGERLRLRGTIVEPRGQRNPGGFDYRFYLRSQGIDALIYPNPIQVRSLGPGNAGRPAASAAALRSRMVEGIQANLPSPSAELLTAVLFGQRHRLPDEVEENFRRAGVGHLMAVSGLHVGLIAALILGFWRRLGLRGKLPLVAAVLLVLGYAYLTGLRPAALRAAVMISLALGALLLDRDRDLPTAIALAALITLVWHPPLLFTVGFQLSYAATLAIIYLYPPFKAALARLRVPAFIGKAAAVTLAAQLGVLPFCAYHFQHVPLGALLFNLLLLPVIPLVLGLGLAGALAALLPAPSLALPFFLACRPLLEFMLAVTGLARLPGFYLAVYPPGVPALLLFYGTAAAALAFYYRRARPAGPPAGGDSPPPPVQPKLPALIRAVAARPLRLLIIALAAAVLLVWGGFLMPSAAGQLTVTFIDVGQGAAALVEAPCGVAILIDGGGESPFRGDPGELGERVLLPFLRRQAVRRIDLVVVSHPHEDHFGGLLPLVEAIPVGQMLISPVPGESPYYRELLERAAGRGIPVDEGAAGRFWTCGSGLVLEVIAPPAELLQGTGSDLNNNSLVMRLHYGTVRILFCGDIENPAVQNLIRRKAGLAAEILLVPHHGGSLAAMPQFLRAVNPRIAVIPVGPNAFGHPHPETLAVLEEAGIAIYRTDLHGAVIIQTDGAGIWVEVMEQPAAVNQ